MGNFWLGVLESATIVDFDKNDGRVALQAKLSHMTPKMHSEDDTFEPYLNSWQISILNTR